MTTINCSSGISTAMTVVTFRSESAAFARPEESEVAAVPEEVPHPVKTIDPRKPMITNLINAIFESLPTVQLNQSFGNSAQIVSSWKI